MEACPQCSKEFERTRKSIRGSFCSEPCRSRYYKNQGATPFTCADCHQTVQVSKAATGTRKREGKYPDLCASCARLRIDTAGPLNGRWRGGHRHWSAGRFGRDKDGLMWKAQRSLAWQRAGVRCEDCGVVNPKRRPDVHHIVPFRVSQSHALGNLRCLCQKCHLTAEAKVQDNWGGHTLTQTRPPKPRCPGCSLIRKSLEYGGFCRSCRQKILWSAAHQLRSTGLSGSEIARRIGVTPQAVNQWLRAPTHIAVA